MDFFQGAVFPVVLCCVLAAALAAAGAVLVRARRRKDGGAPPQTPRTAVFLVGRGGVMDDCRFRLQGNALCIGTDPSRCAIIYPPDTPGIDPVHCQLILRKNGWSLVDFSRAGTYLRGQRLEEGSPRLLMAEDVFWLAEEENSFCIQEGEL